jgi:hypothetical protein
MVVAATTLASAASPPADAVHPDELVAYEAMLTKQALDADANFGWAGCANAKVEHVSTLPVKVDDHPDLPVLLERLRVTGCGHTSVENIHVGRFGGTPPWRMVTALPGESLADMNLQSSALPAVITQVQSELPAGCQGHRLADVYVHARPGRVNFDRSPSSPTTPASGSDWVDITLPENIESQRDKLDLSKAWMEVWPLEVCGQDRTTGVVFIPLRGQNASLFLFLPVWQQIRDHGPGARPSVAPEG